MAQEAHAQANRLHDVKAMDIYSSKLKGGEYSLYQPPGFLITCLFSEAPPQAQLELERMEEEQSAGNNVGLTAWIVEGIEIQQEQL